MQTIIQDKPQNIVLNNKWIKRAGTAGFLFFFIKGLLWTGLTIWAVY